MKLKITKRICVTPAGRKRYLEILKNYMVREYKLGNFDEWRLWVNTIDQADIDYINGLAAEYEWIKLVPLPMMYAGTISIASFFADCCDRNAVYLRLDDDICWIEEGAIKRIFDFRIANPDYFLVLGNIVNNSICNYLHQHIGALDTKKGINGYICIDPTVYYDTQYAEYVHRNFLAFAKYSCPGRDKYKSFSKWELLNYERFSINVISWFGAEGFGEAMPCPCNEEEWLTMVRCEHIARPNCIYGGALFAHFSFCTQMEYLETTDLLRIYKEMSEKL